MKTEIKAIPTAYKGIMFRSRLEARWAMFFDLLDIKWFYEFEGYQIPDVGWYVPDFWLPELNVELDGWLGRYSGTTRRGLFLEIKPALDNPDTKIFDLQPLVPSACLLAAGPPESATIQEGVDYECRFIKRFRPVRCVRCGRVTMTAIWPCGSICEECPGGKAVLSCFITISEVEEKLGAPSGCDARIDYWDVSEDSVYLQDSSINDSRVIKPECADHLQNLVDVLWAIRHPDSMAISERWHSRVSEAARSATMHRFH